MKEFARISLVLALSRPSIVWAQTEAFTRQEACPDSSLTGYTSIANLNDDMAAELDRIAGGGGAPEGGYALILCPGQDFDVSGGNPIRPVLDQVSISCGEPDSTGTECIIVGNEEQLVVEDSSVNGYTISSVNVNGLTFTGFGASAATLTASTPTVFTCTDCTWQDFDGSDFVVDLSGTMTMRVQNGVVGTTEGTANANEAIFSTNNGQLEVDGLTVQGVTTTDFFWSRGNADVTVANADITGNTIQGNLGRVDQGLMVFDNVKIDENNGLETLFSARGANSALELSNTVVSNNQPTEKWTVISSSQGATVTVQDSRFENNQGIEFGLMARGSDAGPPSNVIVERSAFVNNAAFSTSDASTLVAALGAGAVVDLLQVDFQGNSGFTGNFMNFDGTMEIRQSCFIGNSNTLVGFQSKNAQPIVSIDNFIGDDEESAGCGDPGARLGAEAEESEGCFQNKPCSVSCDSSLEESDVCLSQAVFSEQPSESPTEAPTFPGQTEAPSLSLTPTAGENYIVIGSPSPTGATEVEISASPFGSMFPTPFTMPPSRPPAFRPDCTGKGKGNGKGYCSKKKTSKKSFKLPKRNSKRGSKPGKGSNQDSYSNKIGKKYEDGREINKIYKSKASKASKSSRGTKKSRGKGGGVGRAQNIATSGGSTKFPYVNDLRTPQGVYRGQMGSGGNRRRYLTKDTFFQEYKNDDFDDEAIREEEDDDEQAEEEHDYDDDEAAASNSVFYEIFAQDYEDEKDDYDEEEDTDDVYEFVSGAIRALMMPEELEPIVIGREFRI